MTLDHREFINRHHHATAGQVSATPTQRVSSFWGLFPALVLAMCAGGFFVFAIWLEMDQVTQIITGAMVTLAGGLALGAYFSLRSQLRTQEEYRLLHEVLESSRGARMVCAPDGREVYKNSKFLSLCAPYGDAGMQGLISMAGPDSRAHFAMMTEQVGRGLTETIEIRVRSPETQREEWRMITAQPITGYPDYVHWRIDDVTNKHSVDLAIREEREKLIDFTDNAPVGFFSVDEEGRFVFANATFARWLGEDLEKLLREGKLHTYLVHPPAAAQPYDLTHGLHPRQITEVMMKGSGGRTFLASINQAVVQESDGRVRTRAVVHDLTADRQMRQALEASEDRFRRFFEQAPLGIVQTDLHGRIVDSNLAFANMLNDGVENLNGRPIIDIVQDEDRTVLRDTLEKLRTSDILDRPLEITLRAVNGKVATQMFARKFKEGDNIVLHFIDVRERKSLEAQFVQSQKMQAIGQLAGGVAHDFNNLLTAMMGFCDLLLLRHKPGDPSFADIMQIKQNSNRAANLVRQLLAFSRQQTLRPRVLDVTDILTEIAHLLRRLLGAGITLNLVHGHDLGLVRVDEGQMEQVLINLAVNARDAMNGSGTLTISTENFTNRVPKELVAETLPVGHWTLITVADKGCGIAPENLTRIFEPFFTTKEVGQGTGLGLATVYGIIRQTGGFLDVQSTPAHGATFFVYLPRVSETETEKAGPLTSEDDAARDLTGSERILLVEDEDAVRTFSTRALTNKGYEVIAAETGFAALDVLEAQGSPRIDLLITDVVMPGMDGPTLAQKIRALHPDLRIIFISGYTEDKLKDYMGKGIFFLPKPFSLKQLAAKVKDVLSGADV
jgi:two-component system cell cycle sensor histidine kinase/response regulator CckA